MKSKFKLFCFGFGQVAKYFVSNLMNKKINFDLVTTNTKDTKLKKINDLKYKSYFFKNNEFDKNLLKELNSTTKILISIPPKEQEDIVLKVFNKSLKSGKFNWITYLSATSVYGDKQGQWVDENATLEPTSSRGIARLNAEKQWIEFYKNFNLPIQIFRLSGIYSLENNIIKRLKMGSAKIIEKKNHFFSRIHIEDIAEILSLSLKKFNPGQIFNISDNYPCSNEELVLYAANLMALDIPAKIKEEKINDQMLKDFYNDSKKVKNEKMKIFFNYNLKYPTYKEGLEMIRNNII